MSSDGDRVDGRTARAQATRRRIVEATVELHTTLGPARTSISAIAERAGVQRHTVYAHFPDEGELFRACSHLWFERNPFPETARWAAIADPHERAAVALDEVYAYWEVADDDLQAILADVGNVPAMAEALAVWEQTMQAAAQSLLRGRGLRGARRRRALAAARLALDLQTWRLLTGDGALTRHEAVRLMAGLIERAAEPRARR